MKTERVDTAFKDLLEKATPEMEAGWEARASAATSEVRPATRKPLRWVVAAAGLMALIGLGFVPVPLGKATGTSQKAMAMASQATTVHMTGHAWTPKDDYDFERWVSDDGFYRSEKRSGAQLLDVNISWGPRELHYGVEDGQSYAVEWFNPTRRHGAGIVMPNRAYVQGFFESFKRLYEELGVPPPDMKITERRERSLWGGAVDVVEAERTIEGEASISGVSYRDGDIVRTRYEIDPQTSRLLRMSQYKFEGTWEPRYEAEYVWDVEIPQAVLEFRPPKGTTLRRTLWWENRVDQIIAQGDTRDWTVTLHAIDVSNKGDIVLSLSRVKTAESLVPKWYNTTPAIRVEAVGNRSGGYSQLNVYSCYNRWDAGYWTTTLKAESPEADPRTITLTISPYPRSWSEGQSVTFDNVPLPPRQDVDDVFEAETEVIQY